jgi:hypothetical protein
VRHARPGEARRPGGAIPDHVLARSLDDEALASQLVDDLLARNLDTAPSAMQLDLRAAIPIAHGVLAIATFLLVLLAAIGAA